MTFPLEEITYEKFMSKLDAIEKWYEADKAGFPEGARETGLRICRKLRDEVEKHGPENCVFYLDMQYDMPLYKLKEPQD
ncbi:MAG: hypothetical protein ACLFVT_05820 [Syntrophobacteria bacterium]